ncbi:MAG: trypsin-like peptidase domain-containing protein [Chloroflexi bacterium]|nr:trypsin-like peptidase domain-containing protein [Chloroflexota bacterium]
MGYYDDDERRPGSGQGTLFAIIGLALLVGAIGGGVAGGLVAVLVPRDEGTGSRPATNVRATPAGPATTINLQESSAVTETVQKVIPGVVTLLVQASRTDAAGRVVRETNLGSGVVIDPRGYLITNQHVIADATKISVKMPSGEERPGVLVGDDSPFTDIAVIRVQPDGLKPLAVGDSDALALGQQVIAIGSPAFGTSLSDVRNDFNNTVTRGIVSGLRRRWPRQDTVMEDLIQTDAAINNGNSGGALVNLAGELVGITTTVVRGTQQGSQVQGVAFAISSKTFKPIVDEIINTSKVQRPYIGVTHQQITAELARQNSLPVPGGAFVVDVVTESPADKAGIRKSDIITRINQQEISDEMPYLNVLIRQTPNSTVPVTILRAGREMTVDVTIGLR